MAKRVSAAQAKAHLSSLVAEVERGQHYVIERRGKPVAALVSIAELRRLEADPPKAAEPQGAMALVGLWGDLLTDAEIDQFIVDVCAARERGVG